MKNFFLSIIFIWAYNLSVQAQSLLLFDIDTSAYPNVKSKFYAFDEKFNQIITLTKNDVTISENKKSQSVVKVTNPQYVKPVPLSVVLTVDVSASMTGDNMEMAKIATKTFIDMMSMDGSECAVTSFDEGNYLNLDFTNDKQSLKLTIDQLKPLGGTDYNAGFTTSTTGAIDIVKTGKNKKVLIFLTDGLGEANESEIISRAKKEGVTIYCITVGMPAPQVLKNITERTNGMYFENVSSKADAVKIYQKILQISQGLQPSTVEWISSPSCDYLKNVEFTVPSRQLKQNGNNYNAPIRGLIRLDANVQGLNFKGGEANTSKDTVITLTAQNSDITLLSSTSSNPSFSLVNLTFPQIIKAGQQLKITVRCKFSNAEFQSGRIEIINNICSPQLIFTSCTPKRSTTVIPLKVIHPNGNEIFYAGSDTVITWSGVSLDDKLSLQFSADKGKTWQRIAEGASGNKFKWKVPNTTGNEMLVKATIGSSQGNTSTEAKKILDQKITWLAGFVKVSPDNSRMISYNKESDDIEVRDLKTGEILKTFQKPTKQYCFNQDGTQIYLFEPQKPIEVYNAFTFEPMGTLPAYNNNEDFEIRYHARKQAFTSDHTWYAASRGTTVEIFEMKTGKKLYTLEKTNDQRVSSLTKNYLVTIGDTKMCEVYDLKSGKKIFEYKNPSDYVHTAIISDDERYLAMLSWTYSGENVTTIVLDFATKEKLYEYKTNEKMIGLYLGKNIMLCPYKGSSAIVDLTTGNVLNTVSLTPSFVSQDGSFFGVGDYKTEAFIVYSTGFNAAAPSAEDISDLTFTIIKPVITAKDINVGKVIFTDSRDTVINFISNKNKIGVDIIDIRIDGKDKSAFSLVSGLAPFKINSQSVKNVEFRFKPLRVGSHSATVTIVTPFETIVHSISGEGVEKNYALSKDLINMGKVILGSAKDTTVSAVIKNTGKETLVVKGIQINGPDKYQFTLADVSGFTLKSGETKDVKIIFKPVKSGRTTTNIKFFISGVQGNTLVPVFAEGIEKRNESYVVVYGRVLNKSNNQPIEAEIHYHDLNGSDISQTIKTNPDGSYKITLPFGKSFGFTPDKSEHIPESNNLDLTAVNQYQEIKMDLFLSPIEVGKTVSLNNVFFERGKPILLPGSEKELDRLFKMLTDNPGVKIELSGHTDNVGDPAKNLKLSQERVEVIKKYLIDKGISEKRLSGKGYGGSKPVASNATEETRKLNRRVEFTIVGK